MELTERIENLKNSLEACGIECGIYEYIHGENGRKCICLETNYITNIEGNAEFNWYEDNGELVI